jgi:hypothetical protein
MKEEIPPRHRGIPRTLKTALDLGYKKRRVKFADVKGKFVQFAQHGARDGSICGHAPSSRPGYISVCYKNESLKRPGIRKALAINYCRGRMAAKQRRSPRASANGATAGPEPVIIADRNVP